MSWFRSSTPSECGGRLSPAPASLDMRARLQGRPEFLVGMPDTARRWCIRAWFKSGLQLRGGWDRRPKGNAPSNSRPSECDSSWFAHFDSDKMIRHHRDVEKDLRYGLLEPEPARFWR